MAQHEAPLSHRFNGLQQMVRIKNDPATTLMSILYIDGIFLGTGTICISTSMASSLVIVISIEKILILIVQNRRSSLEDLTYCRNGESVRVLCDIYIYYNQILS